MSRMTLSVSVVGLLGMAVGAFLLHPAAGLIVAGLGLWQLAAGENRREQMERAEKAAADRAAQAASRAAAAKAPSCRPAGAA